MTESEGPDEALQGAGPGNDSRENERPQWTGLAGEKPESKKPESKKPESKGNADERPESLPGASTTRESFGGADYLEYSVPEPELSQDDEFRIEAEMGSRHPIAPPGGAAAVLTIGHFDLLPDSGTAPSESLDLEVVTGRPAWFYSQREAQNAEDEANLPSIPRTGAVKLRDTAIHKMETHNPGIPKAEGERVTSRWYALKRIFHQEDDQEELPKARLAEARIPSLAVFSLAGGVGKTSLVATLGRALSAHGERVLLVDTTALGLLPFFFGARELRPGVMRTFAAPGSTDAAVNMVGLDPNAPMPQTQGKLDLDPARQPAMPAVPQVREGDWLVNEISAHARGASRILIDLTTASSSTTRRVLALTPTVLVPVMPDMNSIISLNALDAVFRGQPASRGDFIQPYYLINQFDPSLPLHLDVREVMQQQLGDRLLPFTLRRNTAVSDALAQGMTVMDYAPSSSVAEDYMMLAGWIRSVAAPATPGGRGIRWSEVSD